MDILKLLKSCNAYLELVKTATVHGLTVFHGTDGRKLPSILEKGLLAQRSQGYEKSVYLTHSKETAARYAVNHHSSKHDLPIILEVYISGSKRIKNITRDELDREESAYEYEDVPDDEPLNIFKQDIERILNISRLPSEFERNYLDLREVEGLRGKNIYKILIGYAKDHSLDIQLLKNRMFKIMSPGTDYENAFEIMQDGTLSLTKEYYEQMHQQRYPKNLPAATIKAVWISKVPEELARGREEISISPKLLPHENKSINDSILNIVYKNVNKTNLDQENMENILDDLKSEDVYKMFSDVYSELEEVIKTNDLNRFKELLQNIEYSIQEDYNNPAYAPAEKFVKFSPSEAENVSKLLLSKL